MRTVRTFPGMKPKMALELTGFDGTHKMFRTRFRDNADAGATKLYRPERIREIRMQLMNIPAEHERAYVLPPLIDVRMAKGGVGKTTIACNVATALSMMGYKVLVIDGDPQATLTESFGIEWRTESITHISDLMQSNDQHMASKFDKKPAPPADVEAAIWPLYENNMLDLIPADITMANENWLSNATRREEAFQRLLEEHVAVFRRYDVIIVDSAPGSSLLTTTFMVPAKLLLAVVKPEPKAVAALDVLSSNVQELNSFCKSKIDVQIVVNGYNQTKKPHTEQLAILHARYPDKINDTIVRDFVGFLRESDPENITANAPVLEREPNSVGTSDIISLTRSIIRLYDIKLGGFDPLTQEAAA
ncbi:ParA family protein [Massilia sp. CMS3.1]|uniref:ParA family protein n=1 Tax=Massilia sp. CMS3.1 TaxID=3373083 RepID=UPI003EE46E9A